MSGRKSQRKGAEGERELAEMLTAAGYNVQRGGSQTYGAVPDLVGLPGIHIECKRQEQLCLIAALDQAQRDALRFNDGMPAVFHRRNREPWQVTMRLDDWMVLYARCFQGSRRNAAASVGAPGSNKQEVR